MVKMKSLKALKCTKHNIIKDEDLGGVMFCSKCLDEGLQNLIDLGIIEDPRKDKV